MHIEVAKDDDAMLIARKVVEDHIECYGMTRSQIIELMARGIYEAMPIIEQDAPDGDDTIKWHQLIDAGYEAARDIAIAEADSVFNVITAAGLTILPIEPSEAMLQGACDKHKVGKPMSDTRSDECPRIQSRRRIYGRMITAALKGRE